LSSLPYRRDPGALFTYNYSKNAEAGWVDKQREAIQVAPKGKKSSTPYPTLGG
jgi:hypothetical protein